MNPFVWLNNCTPEILPQPVEGKTKYALVREGRTYYFASAEDAKTVAEFYRGLAWANKKSPSWADVTGKTSGPVSSAIQRDRDALMNLCNRFRFQGSSAWSREEDRKRPLPRVRTERLAPEDRATPKPDPEDEE